MGGGGTQKSLLSIGLSFKQNLFVHLNHKLNKQQVQETLKRYAYLSVNTYRSEYSNIHIYDGKTANYCQKSKATKQSKSQECIPVVQVLSSSRQKLKDFKFHILLPGMWRSWRSAVKGLRLRSQYLPLLCDSVRSDLLLWQQADFEDTHDRTVSGVGQESCSKRYFRPTPNIRWSLKSLVGLVWI